MGSNPISSGTEVERADEKKCNVFVFFWIAFLQLLFFLTKITLLYWDSSTRLLLSLSPLVIIVILYLYCKMERELLANGSKTALLFLVSMERSYPKGWKMPTWASVSLCLIAFQSFNNNHYLYLFCFAWLISFTTSNKTMNLFLCGQRDYVPKVRIDHSIDLGIMHGTR